MELTNPRLASRDTGVRPTKIGARTRMIKWAGWIITLAGIGHTLGSLIETVPDQVGTWLNGSLWSEGDYAEWSDAAAAFWYSVYSFGPPLIVIGVTVLWLDRRCIAPPPFIAWAVATWAVITCVASGPSPLPVLLVAAVLLLVGAWRARQRDSTLGSAANVNGAHS